MKQAMLVFAMVFVCMAVAGCPPPATGTGALMVTIQPAGARAAGAQWQVDGGAWQDSGATLTGLSAGVHTLSFMSIAGWQAPGNTAVTVVEGQTVQFEGIYSLLAETGSLAVSIAPEGARAAGAQWRVDGGAWQNSGATLTGLSVGAHVVSFKAVAGWIAPGNQTVQIAASLVTNAMGTYTLVAETGSLTVVLQPDLAVSAGAQWAVDGGAWQNSGVTLTGLSVGAHAVSFKDIAGWTRPGEQNVNILASQTTSVTGAYTAVAQTGGVTVVIEPQAARDLGAQWRVDGGGWQDSGAVLAGLAAGSHTLSFSDVAGWVKPANMSVNVVANQTLTFTGAYVSAAETGSLTVTISPESARTAGAQWQVDGGAWQDGGATVAGLSVGSHLVSFREVQDWTKPADRTVDIVATQTTTLDVTYTALVQTGSLTVTIEPQAAREAGAQWRVDAGTWHAGGESVSGIPVGDHTVSFNVVAAWIKPVSQTVAVSADTPASASGTYTRQLASAGMVVLAYNDLGMHCMNQDFSDFMILPPYNTLHAQVIDRSGEEPHIVQSGIAVSYTFPSNTTSVGKTNFWEYAKTLFGLTSPLAPDTGLTGNKLSGLMVSQKPFGRTDWAVTGIPITPLDDDGSENPYPLAVVTVTFGGQPLVQTQAVAPVSWEISCDLCHRGTSGVSTGTMILRSHDRLHGTTLEKHKPVTCGACHAQPALGMPGIAGRPNLSSAMHAAHAPRMFMAGLEVDCYACHPGVRTQCLRDVHYSLGFTCVTCHGGMTDVADPDRVPWQTEPRCDDCHPLYPRIGVEYEQPNTLYRNSKGHHGVHCAACHGSPHAITPTVKTEDNIQAIAVQGHAGKIDACPVCHSKTPGDDPFDHRYSPDD